MTQHSPIVARVVPVWYDARVYTCLRGCRRMIETIMSQLTTSLLIPLLVTLSAWVARELISVAQAHRKSIHTSWVLALYDAATKAVEDAVGAVMQVSVAQLKAIASDGKLTPEEAKAAFQTVVNQAWMSLAKSVQDDLVKLEGSIALAKQQVIAPKVEPAVANAKAAMLDQQAKAITDPAAQASAKVVARQAIGLTQ